MEPWIRLNKTAGRGDDTVQITLESNRTIYDRTAVIHAHSSGLNKDLSIIQRGLTDEIMNKIKFIIDTDTNTVSLVNINSVGSNISSDIAELVFTVIKRAYVSDEPSEYVILSCYDVATEEIYFPVLIERTTTDKLTIQFSQHLKIIVTSHGTITLMAS